MKLLEYLQCHLKRRVLTPYRQASLITRNKVHKKKTPVQRSKRSKLRRSLQSHQRNRLRRKISRSL